MSQEISVSSFLYTLKYKYADYINEIARKEKLGIRHNKYNDDIAKIFLLSSYINILVDYFNIADETDNNFFTESEIIDILQHFNNITGSSISFPTTSISEEEVDPEEPVPSGVLVDKDGNIYTSVIIGTQEWIVENYRTGTYADGTSIPNITDNTEWMNDTVGAWCYYENDPDYELTRGRIYNGHTVLNARGFAYLERDGSQETGWRVPSASDMGTLISYLGGAAVAGGKLKETGIVYWYSDSGATNEVGFTARPSGFRQYYDGTFSSDMTKELVMWESTTVNQSELNRTLIFHNSNDIYPSGTVSRSYGHVTRLVRDLT